MVDGLRLDLLDEKRHATQKFDCGVARYNRHVRGGVKPEDHVGLAREFALCTAHGSLVGYFIVGRGRLSVLASPPGGRGPRRLPVPSVWLAGLAVDRAYQGRGLGTESLVLAIRYALEIAQFDQAVVIEADTADEHARAFCAHHGFWGLSDDLNHMYLSVEAARASLQPLWR